MQMTDTKDTDRRDGEGRKPLTLNRSVSAGTVKQSFSHGRQKSVVVEVKKKRANVPDAGGGAPRPTFVPNKPAGAPAPAAPVASAAPAAPAAQAPAPVRPRTGGQLGLSARELEARTAAVERARSMEDERRIREEADAEARARREESERRKMEAERRAGEAEAARKAREEAETQAAEERARRVEELQKKVSDRIASERAGEAPVEEAPEAEVDPEAAAAAEPGRRGPAPIVRDEGGDLLSQLGGRVKKQRQALVRQAPVAKPKVGDMRRGGRLTINAALESDDERQRSLASVRRARERERERRMNKTVEPVKQVREVIIPETITVMELAQRMAERLTDVVRYLMKQGQMMKGNDVLDTDTAELIATDFGHTVRRVAESDVEIGLEGTVDDDGDLSPRPPVVTIMGHVDHGKTSLLDAIRSTDVVKGEAGGITQHIGAYQVRLPDGQRVTFLDTPGHAAFSAMRARGAKATDIVVLVVAADDGVMPQTIEALNHAKQAGVPMIIAINKIDKQDADPTRVLTDLLQHEIVTEAMGGETQAVEVSALKRMGLDDLLEAILLQAEVLDLKANPARSAEGIVIESKLDRGKGSMATVLVQRGTLKRGDIIVAGTQWGRVRAMTDERLQQLDSAGPSLPVEILGLDGAPEPGEQMVVVENEARAREVTDYRIRAKREKAAIRPSARSGLESMLARIKEAEIKEFPLIVKADVQGSAEAISGSLEKLATNEVRGRVIHQGVGGITETDVMLSKSSGAPILAFNTRAPKQVRDMAENEGVEIRYYSVIYNLIDDVRDILSGMLEPERRENFLGYAEILQVFAITKVGKVAGCRVSEGNIRRGCGVRLLRDDVVIHEGKLSTLKRFKDEVSDVTAGQECGMGFEGYQDIREGDRIECFDVEIIKRSL
jgi:translation initiation factor IF-2